MTRKPKSKSLRAKAWEYITQLRRYFRQWWRREPHLVVYTPEGEPYLVRWWIIPRNPLLNVYLHKFVRDDNDRALHDHPWVSLSILIKGTYVEHLERSSRTFHAPAVIPRGCPHPHRLELVGMMGARDPVWTIFITGPKVREWGFLCPNGWVPWEEFILGDGTEANRAGSCPE